MVIAQHYGMTSKQLQDKFQYARRCRSDVETLTDNVNMIKQWTHQRRRFSKLHRMRENQDWDGWDTNVAKKAQLSKYIVSIFSTSIRFLSSFFIKHSILPVSLPFCPSVSLSVVPHAVFLISAGWTFWRFLLTIQSSFQFRHIHYHWCGSSIYWSLLHRNSTAI